MKNYISALIILFTILSINSGCGSSKPQVEDRSESQVDLVSNNFLNEENYFVSEAKGSSKRKEIAIKMAEARVIQSLSNQVDDYITGILQFYENLEISSESDYPDFSVMLNEESDAEANNSFSEAIEFKNEVYENEDGYQSVVYGRLSKSKLPDLITPQRFVDGEEKDRFLEQDGIKWLKNKLREAP